MLFSLRTRKVICVLPNGGSFGERRIIFGCRRGMRGSWRRNWCDETANCVCVDECGDVERWLRIPRRGAERLAAEDHPCDCGAGAGKQDDQLPHRTEIDRGYGA